MRRRIAYPECHFAVDLAERLAHAIGHGALTPVTAALWTVCGVQVQVVALTPALDRHREQRLLS